MSKPRLLVVEDQVDLRRLLEEYLTVAGYAVESAPDGVQGLERARANPPDAIIVDLAMPGIDGAELCRRLRGDGSLPVIPILLYSGIPGTDPRVVAATTMSRVAYEPKGTLRRLMSALDQLLQPISHTEPAPR